MIAPYNLPFLVSFTVITCCKCGIAFGVDATVRQRWVENGTYFYCPAGHRQHYGEFELAKLRKEVEAQKQALEDQKRQTEFAKQNAAAERQAREHTQRQLQARKGVNTRLRNRIKHGVCPCCRRNFGNLQRHMKTKHPQFNKDDGEA